MDREKPFDLELGTAEASERRPGPTMCRRNRQESTFDLQSILERPGCPMLRSIED